MTNLGATYQVFGTSKTLKMFADVDDTISAIKRIVAENYLSVEELASALQAKTEEKTLENIWDFVRDNIQYKNDAAGKEQLRRPQRTLHDKIGDCDDFSILISSILTNLDIKHELLVTAYKEQNKWQHIYPVAFDNEGNRYTIDCVPEIPYFNYEAKGIKSKIIINMPSSMELLKKDNMKLEELGSIDNTSAIDELTEEFNLEGLQGSNTEDEEFLDIQGLLGNVVIVDQDEEYDTVLSGSEIYRNLVLRQLVEAKTILTKELSTPTELSQYSDTKKDLYYVNDIIASFEDEDDLYDSINDAIKANTLYKNFYKTIQYAIESEINGLSGNEEDDTFYLKILDQEDMLDQIMNDDLEGLGKWKFMSKLKSKIRTGVKRFKERHPKLAKIGQAFKRYNPATFAVRRSIEVFYRANAFKIASKTALGYATESQAKKLGYNKSEWLRFVEGKKRAEKKWYSLGGKTSYFKKMIMNSKGARQLGLRGTEIASLGEIGGEDSIGELAIAPAVIAAAAKVFGSVIKFFKNLKLKNKAQAQAVARNSASTKTKSASKYSASPSNIDNMKTDDKSGVTEEVITDESGKEKTIYKDAEGNEIGKAKAFFLKHKKMIMIVAVVTVVGIIAIIIWKIRQRSLQGLGAAGLSSKQENFIRRQGLNNRAYGSLIREEIKKDGKKNTSPNRKTYYKKVFKEAFSRPISQQQVTATLNHNDKLKQVRTLAKQYGGGSDGWRKAWSEVKKKR